MDKTEPDIKDSNVEQVINKKQNYEKFAYNQMVVDAVGGGIFRKTKEDYKDHKSYFKSPVDRDSEVYNMNHKRRGRAIIFNHIHFKKLAKRVGALHDSTNLSATLERLGFIVDVYLDPTLKVISKVLQEASAEDHTDADCLVIAAMSHGESGYLFSADSMYSADVLWTPFIASRCNSLAGKPKLFFIQACRGTQLDAGIELTQETDSMGSYSIPNHADIFVAYSTFDGYYSWRNQETGSWFIQALCEELNKNGMTHDLLRIMTAVIRHVAIDYESFVPHSEKFHKKKQMPSIVSMLTRLVYFPRKDETMMD